MATIKQLKKLTNPDAVPSERVYEDIYPVTHERGVMDDNGNNLEQKLQNIESDIQQVIDDAESDMQDMLEQSAVRTDTTQDLTDAQKATALGNLGISGVDDVPTIGSDNLVKSGGVSAFVYTNSKKIFYQEDVTVIGSGKKNDYVDYYINAIAGRSFYISVDSFLVPQDYDVTKCSIQIRKVLEDGTNTGTVIVSQNESTTYSITDEDISNGVKYVRILLLVSGNNYSVSGGEYIFKNLSVYDTSYEILKLYRQTQADIEEFLENADERPIPNSDNIVKSGGVDLYISALLDGYQNKIDLSSFTQENIYIGSNGVWSQNGTTKSIFIPVVYNNSFIEIYCVSNTDIAFVTSNEYNAGDSVSFASGEDSKHSIYAKTNEKLYIPSNAKYMVLRVGDVSVADIYVRPVENEYTMSNNLISDTSSGFIRANGQIQSHQSYRYGFCVVSPKKYYYVNGYATGEANLVIAILNDGSTSVLVRNNEDEGKTFIVPEDCFAIYVNCHVDYDLVCKEIKFKDNSSQIANNYNEVQKFISNGFFIHQALLYHGAVTEPYAQNWVRTPAVPVHPNDSYLYTGISSGYGAVFFFDENMNYVSASTGGELHDLIVTVPTGAYYMIAVGRCLEGDVTPSLTKLNKSFPIYNDTEQAHIGIGNVASFKSLEFGSARGYTVFQPMTENVPNRYYLCPNGNPGGNSNGIKSKFETFATDYINDHAGYTAINWLVYGNVFHLGANKGGNGGTGGTSNWLKQIYGGKYNSSNLITTSARVEFDGQDENITIYADLLKILLANGNEIPEYADNSAAITGGLTVGCIYRTGDVLKIVHT